VSIPELDEELRARLERRYGSTIRAWLDEQRAVLHELTGRWDLEWGTLVRRGSMSIVIRCRVADGPRAVLKITPDRDRLAREAAALSSWRTTAHAPAVLAVDESAGALLLEEIEPGTPLVESPAYPSIEAMSALVSSLHGAGRRDPRFRPVAARIGYLFDSGRKHYERRLEAVELIPPALYERGRRLALRLAADAAPSVLLHGDLTPVNILDGGAERGLVAVDPAPCLGDPAFDAIDLVLWRAKDLNAIAARVEELAPSIDADAGRLLDWCAAFAGMTALELAEAPGTTAEDVEPFVALAART